MRRVVPIALALLLLRAITPCVAPAASFDCTKAATAGEKIVCGDPALSRLDEVLADAYRQALSASVEPETLKAEQREWLRAFRNRCGNRACLERAYQGRIGQLHGLGGFTAANGMSETEVADFIRAELKLVDKYSQPKLLAVRSPTETVAHTIVFFVTDWERGAVKRGTIDVSKAQPRVLRVEDYECNCQGIGPVSYERLVASERDFVLASYGGGGTCTGVEYTDIFRVGEGGTFERVWHGETYSAGSPEWGVNVVDVIKISFPRTREGRDRAILRTVRQVRCDASNCFCKDGTLINEYVELFLWDPAKQRFRPAR